jgi:hypothetical protein
MNGVSDTASYLDISKVAEGRISFRPAFSLTSGSSERAAQSLRLVRSVFRQKISCVVTQSETEMVIECDAGPIEELLQVCSSVERKLEKIRVEPLPAKAVEEILAISSAERRRWSKDGRLPHVGNSLFRQAESRSACSSTLLSWFRSWFVIPVRSRTGELRTRHKLRRTQHPREAVTCIVFHRTERVCIDSSIDVDILYLGSCSLPLASLGKGECTLFLWSDPPWRFISNASADILYIALAGMDL